MDHKRPGLALKTHRITMCRQMSANRMSSSSDFSPVSGPFMVDAPVPMHLLSVAILRLREIARSRMMEHHPAPHPVGGEQHQDLVTTLSILPFPAKCWKSQAQERKRWRNTFPTATKSVTPPANHTKVRLPVCLTLAAPRPPAHQCVGDCQLAHFRLGSMTLTISLQWIYQMVTLRCLHLIHHVLTCRQYVGLISQYNL